MAKSGSSRSPLARPQTLIHKWATEVQEYLYLPDPSPFYMVLGVLVANMMAGEPVWLILVGASGAGKTTAIQSIIGLDKVKVVDVIEGKAGLMSGTAKKDRVKGATGGLLFEIGQRGLLVCKEFTATLSQDRKQLTDALGTMRIIADGDLARTIGSDGGRRIEWKGMIGFIGASTSSIDGYYRVMGELGQRWMMYRFNESDGYQEAVKGLTEKDRAESMGNIQRLTAELIQDLSLEWGCHYDCGVKVGDGSHVCVEGPGKRELTKGEVSKLTALGTFVSRARSIVPRDERTGEINGVKDVELPNRIVKALGKVYLALEVLGLDKAERWALIYRTAWDSITPKMRGMLLGVLNGAPGLGDGDKPLRLSMVECEAVLGVSTNTTRKVVGDLKALGLVDQNKGTGEIWISDWARGEVDKCR